MDELCETEVKFPGGRRLDSATNKTATEIEQNFHNIPKAVKRLKVSGRPQRVLPVPQNLMAIAKEEMKEQGLTGTVKNISGTKRMYVREKKIVFTPVSDTSAYQWYHLFHLADLGYVTKERTQVKYRGHEDAAAPRHYRWRKKSFKEVVSVK